MNRLDDPSEKEEEELEDDLSSPRVIAGKLKGLLEVASSKLSGEDDFEDDTKAYLSLLAMLRLTPKFAAQRAQARDAMYKSSGVPGTKTDLSGIDEALQYAALAYEDDKAQLRSQLETNGFKLLVHSPESNAGSVGYYVALCPKRKLALVGVKGTSTLGDVVTDSCGRAVTHELEGDGFGGRTTIRCHEGIMLSAKALAENIEPFMQIFEALGYRTIIAGHSLGAGAGALLGTILCSKMPSLLSPRGWTLRGIIGSVRRGFGRILRRRKVDQVDISSLFDRGDKLHVVAFATPPVLDYETALLSSQICTSVVNDVDVIPRLSLSNVVILVKTLHSTREMLAEKDMVPEEVNTVTALALNAASLDISKDEASTIRADELIQTMERALDSVELDDPDHLYVPGRILFMFKNHTAAALKAADAADYDDNFAAKVDDSLSDKSLEMDFIVTDGSAKALRMIELDENMITDHFLQTSYNSSVCTLVK